MPLFRTPSLHTKHERGPEDLQETNRRQIRISSQRLHIDIMEGNFCVLILTSVSSICTANTDCGDRSPAMFSLWKHSNFLRPSTFPKARAWKRRSHIVNVPPSSTSQALASPCASLMTSWVVHISMCSSTTLHSWVTRVVLEFVGYVIVSAYVPRNAICSKNVEHVCRGGLTVNHGALCLPDTVVDHGACGKVLLVLDISAASACSACREICCPCSFRKAHFQSLLLRFVR